MGISVPEALTEAPVAIRPTDGVRLPSRAWLAFLVFGLGMAIAGGLAADAGAIKLLPLTITGIATVAAILVGVGTYRPARPLPWRLLAVCTLLTTGGGAVAPVGGPLADLGQLSTILGSLCGFVGFAMLIRGRIPGGDRAALLDAAILASGTGVVIWAFGFAPYVVADRQGSAVSVVFFYPAIIALAMVGRMWFLGGTHRPATRLIVLVVVASNVILILDVLTDRAAGGALSLPSTLAAFAEVVFLGAAALHPAMAVSPVRQQTNPEGISRRRMIALTAALLVNPATLAIEASGGREVDPAPYVIGGVLIGLLVIARLADALRQLGESLRERESLMDLLRRQALYDDLTSLPNRSLFQERLATDFAGRSGDRPLAVLMIDLDDFKSVNDAYGHEAGDALLVAVGRRLHAAIRGKDIAARLGGDEFVIALPAYADALGPTHVAERVLATLTEPFDIAGHSLVVQASIGVAVATPEDRSPDDLVRNADMAMYLAKSRGKGRVEVFEPSMRSSALTQLQLRTDLAEGIAAGELRLHYQPVVDLQTGRTVGYEALVRWLRGDVLVPPLEFIPLAESSGLIGPITDWVVEEACRTVSTWGTPPERPWVSVNLPSSQLVRPDIVTFLARTLEASGMAPNRLVVELTESSLLEIDVARPAIAGLSEIGVRLAIDDFGTGYSALSYLAHLPIDILKVDRSFVATLEPGGPEEAIAEAIIALANRLGLTTIGEGIETPAQLDQLSALGCDLGQGYYLGRPAPMEDRGRAPFEPRVRRRLVSVNSLIA